MDTDYTSGVRAIFGAELELRDAKEHGTLGVLAGFLARFNEWAEIDSAVEGHFLESIAPGAFKKTFQEGRDRIRCIFHHGNDPSVGVRVLGPVNVLEERGDEGAYAEVPLLDTSYNRDLEPGIRAGLYGMSFRFGAVRSTKTRSPRKSAHNPEGIPERVLTELYVPEFGPTPFAAYAGATAGMRSITDDVLADRLAQREVDALRASHPSLFAPNAKAKFAIAFPNGSSSARPATSTSTGVDVTVFGDGARSSRHVTDRLYERSIHVAASKPWLITEDSYNVIEAILDERAAGHRPTREEIAARLGIRSIDPAPAAAGETPASPVAVIRMEGPIVPRGDMFTESSGLTSIEGMQAQFRAAVADDNVQAIAFDINSPGGQSDLVPEFAAEIAAARGTKPIVAIANTQCCSAAYWLASQCDELVASPSADVGSVGVYCTHVDTSAANRLAGRRVTVVSSQGSPHKTEFSSHQRLSADAQEEMQRRVDNLYGLFVEAVAEGRDTTTDDVQANYGMGRVLMASDALTVGMVDRIATADTVLAELLEGAAAAAPDTSAEPPPAAPAASHPRTSRRAIDPATLQPKEDQWPS